MFTCISSMCIVGETKAFCNAGLLVSGLGLHRGTKLCTNHSHQHDRRRLLSAAFSNRRQLIRQRVTYEQNTGTLDEGKKTAEMTELTNFT